MPLLSTDVHVLVTVPPAQAARYENNLLGNRSLTIQIVTQLEHAYEILADRDHRIDVFVIDNQIGNVHRLIRDLRQTYPRLLIVMVDEQADFGLPGQADEFTNEPFRDDDLVRRINQLISERRQETLRSDSLPAMREISQSLRAAVGLIGKQQAAVDTVVSMDYAYVAYFHVEHDELVLKAQNGPKPIVSIAPTKASDDDLMMWVARNAQSRITNYGDKLTHPLVAKGRLGAAACVPVAFDNVTYGVLIAFRDRPNSINQEGVLMLELVGAQLASVTARELK